MYQSPYEITPYMAFPLLRFSSREYVQKNQRIIDEKLGEKNPMERKKKVDLRRRTIRKRFPESLGAQKKGIGKMKGGRKKGYQCF